MPCQFKESHSAKTILLLACLALSSCSSNSSSRPEDSNRCLRPTTLKPLKSAPGVLLPKERENYQLPHLQIAAGPVGPEVDLYPPAQLLAFPSGSKAYFTAEEAILQFGSGEKGGDLWKKLKEWLVSQQIALVDLDDKRQLVTTDWVEWPGAKKKLSHYARYQFTMNQACAGLLFKSKVIALRQGGTDLPLSARASKRHNANMLNLVAAALAKDPQGQELNGSSATSDRAK